MPLDSPMLARYPVDSVDTKEHMTLVCQVPLVHSIPLYTAVTPDDMQCNLGYSMKREKKRGNEDCVTHIDVSNMISIFPIIERSKLDGRLVYIPLKRSLSGLISLSGHDSGR